MVKNRQKAKRKGSKEKNKTFVQKNNWFLPVIILIITFVVFSPALKNGFTNWDDDLYVTNNSLIKNVPLSNLGKFGENVAGNFHPLTMLSLALDYRLFEMDPFYFHLVNILFHLLNTLLVFVLIKKLTKGNLFVVFFTAIFFAIHPMHVESVVWISERKDVLYAFFFLTGLLFYHQYILKKKIVWLMISFLTFVLSVLSKSAAVVFPVVLFLIDYFEKRKINLKSIAEKLPFLAVSIWIGLVAIGTQSQSSALGEFAGYSLFERITIAAYGFITYVIKFAVPFKLSSFHPYPDGKLPVTYILALIVTVLFLIYVIIKFKKQRELFFGTVFYLVTIALVLQLFPVGDALIAERYTYIPYIGLAMVYLIYTQKTIQKRPFGNLKYVVLGILAVQLIFFANVTYLRTKVWKDSESLWTDVIGKYPYFAEAYINRGHFYRSENNYQEAIQNYNKAIELDDNRALAFYNRGKAFFDTGQFDKALTDMNKAIELEPDFPEAYSNRGSIYAMKNEYLLAIADFDKAIEMKPGNTEILANRTLAHFYAGNTEKALEDATAFLKKFPDDADMHNVGGLCYRRLGKDNEALAEFTRAIQLAPQQGAYYQNRSYLLNRMGDNLSALNDINMAKQLGINVDENYVASLKN
ncbi:MAG: tetratricopeptide repeat protein [Prolixibacteraceae bacterium]|nr:tetratricopeptide repeat protein [Prolixibacteraceae bacterium]